MFKRTILATAIAGLLTVTSVNAGATGNADTWAEASITTAYTLNEHLNPFEVEVDVRGGTAFLTGTVESGIEKDLAEQIALGVDGVTRVDNRLVVATDAPRSRATSRLATSVNDATVTARVKSKLLWNQSTSGTDIKVTTAGGEVKLTGEVKTPAERDLVRRITMNTDGVRTIDDQLKVADPTVIANNPTPIEAVGDLAANVSDAWVSTKVKSALLYSSMVDGTAIDVATDNGVVTLTGRVWDAHERAAAMAVAEGIIGVKAVKADLHVQSSAS